METSKVSLPACLPDAVTARDASRKVPQGPVDAEVWRRVAAALQTLSEADFKAWDGKGMLLFRQVFNDLGVELVQELEDMIEIIRGGDKESEENQAEVVGAGGDGKVDGPGLLDMAMIEAPAGVEGKEEEEELVPAEPWMAGPVKLVPPQ